MGNPVNDSVGKAALDILKGGATSVKDYHHYFGIYQENREINGEKVKKQWDIWYEKSIIGSDIPIVDHSNKFLHNVFYKTYKGLHNKMENKTKDAVIIYDASKKAWNIDRSGEGTQTNNNNNNADSAGTETTQNNETTNNSGSNQNNATENTDAGSGSWEDDIVASGDIKREEIYKGTDTIKTKSGKQNTVKTLQALLNRALASANLGEAAADGYTVSSKLGVDGKKSLNINLLKPAPQAQLTEIPSTGGHKIKPGGETQFVALRSAMSSKIRKNLKISSSYRTISSHGMSLAGLDGFSGQLELYALRVAGKRSSACSIPTSNGEGSKHQTGRALDLKVGSTKLSEDATAYTWMQSNASTYKFKELAGEPWHWNYQG